MFQVIKDTRVLSTLLLLSMALSGLPARASDSPCFTDQACTAGTLTAGSEKVLESSCNVTRAASCADIKDQSKLYSCDVKSYCSKTTLQSAIAVVKGCAIGGKDSVWVPIVETAKGLSQMYAHMKECDSSIQMKQEMVNKFNDALPSGEKPFVAQAQTLQTASCSDISQMLNTKATIIAERRAEAYNNSLNPPAQAQRSSANKAATSKDALDKFLDQLKIKRECYNTQALAEMYCEAGGFVALTIVPGAMALRAARLAKLAELAATEKAAVAAAQLANADKAASAATAAGSSAGQTTAAAGAGQATAAGVSANRATAATAISEYSSSGKVSMETATSLSDGDRVQAAEALVNRNLTAAQKTALIKAHEVGQEAGAGVGSYTGEQIAEKARILKEAGFSQQEREVLIKNGIAGGSADSSTIVAGLKQNKTFRMLSEYEQNSRLKNFTARDKVIKDLQADSSRVGSMSPKELKEYMYHVRGAAAASRIAGETANSLGDLTSGRSLLKESISYFEKVKAKVPGIVDSARDRDELLRMKTEVGDIEGAAKTFEENARKDFAAKGYKSEQEALNSEFRALKEEAESGPSRNVLDNERGTNRSIATGRPLPATNAASAYNQQLQQLRLLEKVLSSKPSWLVNVDSSRELAGVRSMIQRVQDTLRGRGYNVDSLMK